MYKILSKIGANFICVSETTSAAAKSQLPFLKERKKEVILEASKFATSSVANEATMNSGGEPYFLFVANLQTNKNPLILWDAMKLVQAGSDWSIKWVGWDEQGLISKYEVERSEKISARFRSLGRVSDQELSDLYRGALALIVTSLDEGFCLPVVEAHSHACPVIASDIPILREVAGQGAKFFDPNNSVELASSLQELIENPQMYKDLSVRGRQNSTRFSWAKTARQTLDYARKVLT
jgi:glycosyltransferase involved in cell wall biosynthesis